MAPLEQSSGDSVELINHLTIQPTVDLTDQIKAAELIPPSGERGLSAHKIWIPANAAYPPHTHPSPHIILVMEGGGWVKVGKGDVEVPKAIGTGDVFHVPAHVVHQVGADTRGMIMIALSVGSKPLTDPDRLRVSL